jgi:hypothetical protein
LLQINRKVNNDKYYIQLLFLPLIINSFKFMAMKIKYLIRFCFISSTVLLFIGVLAKLQHYHPWDEILLIGSLLNFAVALIAVIYFFYITSKNNKTLLIKCLFWVCLANSIVLTLMGTLLKLNHTTVSALVNFAIAAICLFFMFSNNKKQLNKTK